jgi:hypothetical protein
MVARCAVEEDPRAATAANQPAPTFQNHEHHPGGTQPQTTQPPKHMVQTLNQEKGRKKKSNKDKETCGQIVT